MEQGQPFKSQACPQSGIEFAPFTFPIRHNPVDLIMLRIARGLKSTDNMPVLPKRLGIGSIFVAIAMMIFLGGCADVRQGLVASAQRWPELFPGTTASEGYWRGDDIRGSAKIVVHVTEQRAYFYKGRKLVGESTVSTGKRGFDTPPGHYRVIQKDKDHVSSEFGDYVNGRGEVVKSNIDIRKDSQPAGTHFDGARMPYFMRFNGGYGMHAGYVPRFRASHGCIRLPARMARHFFENTPEDTPVIVKGD
jgi:L,D-transpeptidase catalytic domain